MLQWLQRNLKDIVTILLSIIGLIFGFCGYLKSIEANNIAQEANAMAEKRDQIQIVENTLLNAPLLIADADRLNMEGLKGNISLDPSIEYNNTSVPDFTLDRRSFLYIEDVEGSAVFGPEYSLIIDTRNTKNNVMHADARAIAFCSIELKNVGFDLVSFSINNIVIYFSDNVIANLTPNTDKSRLNIFIKNNEFIPLYISYIFNEGIYALVDSKTWSDPKYYVDKMLHVGDNVFNSVVPVIVDKYNKLEIYMTTRNIYNEEYEQKITISIVGNIYIPTFELIGKKEQM